MGFDVDLVAQAFEEVGVHRNNGHEYLLEPAYISDITAKLCGEI